MSALRRVLLLLSVAVLLREGGSNSPLDFLRDLKNRIFPLGNATESAEEPSAQCSASDQNGACFLKKTITNETSDEGDLKISETLDHSDLFNGTDSEETEPTLELKQYEENETASADIYNINNNTIYYDDQGWNNTASNNTENYTDDFENPANSQYGTGNGNETNTQIENARSKRQINKVEINITLKAPGISTPSLLNMNTTVLAGKSENSTVNSSQNSISDLNEEKQNITNESESIKNNSIVNNLTRDTDENKTMVKTEVIGNNTKDKIFNDGQKPEDIGNSTLDNSGDLGLSYNETWNNDDADSINVTEGIYQNDLILANCSNCGAEYKRTDFQNNTLELETDFNTTTNVDDKHEIINDFANNNSINITKLKDILDNSTRIFEKIVQNIVPGIIKGERKGNETNSTTIENEQNINIREELRNLLDITRFNKDGSSNANNNLQSNSTIGETNATNGKNENTIVGTANKAVDGTINLTVSEPLKQNLNESIPSVNKVGTITVGKNVSNTTETATDVKRERRSINLTVLAEDDEDYKDFSASSFPEANESLPSELPTSTSLNSSESSLWNDTQAIEVAGPICTKRFEQCTNSTDCCEDYECIGMEGNNSTSYCDIRVVNVTLVSTPLPTIAE